MGGFTKLHNSILDSTVWRESKETRLVWVTMLAMADADGCVEASMPGLADRARVTLAECVASLERLSAPDPYSRTPDFEGRRIEAVPGGWVLLNHALYRKKLSEEDQRIRKARNKADQRERESRPC